jgi:hypothetical protein
MLSCRVNWASCQDLLHKRTSVGGTTQAASDGSVRSESPPGDSMTVATGRGRRGRGRVFRGTMRRPRRQLEVPFRSSVFLPEAGPAAGSGLWRALASPGPSPSRRGSLPVIPPHPAEAARRRLLGESDRGRTPKLRCGRRAT